jgi:two-component system CheB/CheR fusion protein
LGIGLRRALDVLSQRCELDFACYEPAPLHGGIQRRIERVAESDAAYADLLYSDPDEIDSLYRDVLVGVTEFFAEDDAYADLARALRALVKRANRELRGWIAGCATGEELYSVAILLDEARTHLDWSGRIRLFATDVHQDVLKQAAEATFPKEALDRISPARRRRYFIEDGTHVRAVDPLREMAVFANHNLLTDAPFSQLDLICCRNVLKYFEAAARARVLETFRWALRPGGVLFLGAHEQPPQLARGREWGFEPLQAGSSLYVRLEERRRPRGTRMLSELRAGASVSAEADLREAHPELYEALLARYAPPAFVLDARERLVRCVGGAEKLLALEPPRGVLLPLIGLLEGRLRSATAELLERYRQHRGGVHAAADESYRITVSALGRHDALQRSILVEVQETCNADRE